MSDHRVAAVAPALGVVVSDLDPRGRARSRDANGEPGAAVRARDRRFDELPELTAEPLGIGEDAQTGHLDVDDPVAQERLDTVERGPDLVEEVDRAGGVGLHAAQCTGGAIRAWPANRDDPREDVLPQSVKAGAPNVENLNGMAPENAPETETAAEPRAPRRGSYRARAEIPAMLLKDRADPHDGWLRCWLRDLSTTGAAIEGTLDLSLGDHVRLRFGKPNELFTFDASVARVDGGPRVFGLHFGPHDAREADALYGFVMELAQEYVKYRSRHLSWEQGLTPAPAPAPAPPPAPPPGRRSSPGGGLAMRV